MSWIMKRDKNKISNTDEADGSGDSWNCLVKIWELAAHNPCELEGMSLDTDNLMGMSKDIDNLTGLIELEEELEGKIGVGC